MCSVHRHKTTFARAARRASAPSRPATSTGDAYRLSRVGAVAKTSRRDDTLVADTPPTDYSATSLFKAEMSGVRHIFAYIWSVLVVVLQIRVRQALLLRPELQLVATVMLVLSAW